MSPSALRHLIRVPQQTAANLLASSAALCAATMALALVAGPASALQTRPAPPAATPSATSPATPAPTPIAKPAPAKASHNAKKAATVTAGTTPAKPGDAKPEKTAYDYYLPGADGKNIPLSAYKDKFVLIVNLARKSSYNDQLPALIKLNDTYKDKGLVVIGVPSNDFGAEEPGTDPEIQKAYTDAKVDFPIMAVSKLSGDGELPVAEFLTKSKGAPAGGPIHWNYTKFVIDKKGTVIARLSPDVAPDSPEFLSTIDQILDGTFKPPKKGGDKPPAGDDEDDE